jgi:hypothetical protein
VTWLRVSQTPSLRFVKSAVRDHVTGLAQAFENESEPHLSDSYPSVADSCVSPMQMRHTVFQRGVFHQR